MVTQTTDVSEQANGTVELPADERRRLFADSRRRTAVQVLADSEAPVSLSDLAGDVVDRCDGATDATELSVALHHVHLPKLAECDLVEYDTERNCVTNVQIDQDLLG